MKQRNDLYRRVMLLMMRSKQHVHTIMEKRSMTPVQGMLLMLLEPGKTMSMQSLSTLMSCDASNTTGLVDRLDSHNLIERTVDPSDRRVKLITLSEQGLECREQLLKGLREAETADLQKLTAEEQESFSRIIDKLTA
jgi:DNA-binding MarR family transcriptional regulator